MLFYEDPEHIKPFQEKFPAYKDQFEPWAHHTNAMHQYFCMSLVPFYFDMRWQC